MRHRRDHAADIRAVLLDDDVVEALRGLEQPEAVAARRGLTLEHVAPAPLLRAQAAGTPAKVGA